jgi:hypothetical protein
MRVALVRFICLFSLFFISVSEGWAQGGASQCEVMRNEKALGPLGSIGRRPIGTELAPFSSNTPFGRIPSGQAARSLAGYYCDSVHLHPMMMHVNGGFLVIGPSFERFFRSNQINDAFAAYRSLLSQLELQPSNLAR